MVHYFHSSVRKHLIQKLTDEGLPPNQIVQISGHKNINSLNNYSHLKAEQTKNISSILSNCSAPVINPPSKKLDVKPTVITETSTSSSQFSLQNASKNQDMTAVQPSTNQAPVPSPMTQSQILQNPWSFQRTLNPSNLGGLFAGNTIHGNININFNQSHSQQLSQNTAKLSVSCSPRVPMADRRSPIKNHYKRIRIIESDSD